jgi:8-oxo-dGTP pyrophosphatase MutT (NUDIX family)
VPSVLTLRRLGYRVAFRVLQVRWALLAPDLEGVKCLITDGDRVLLVRHTYGPRAWDLPGGAARRGESALATARREMEEELGLGDLDWRPLGELRGRMYHRHDAIHLLTAAAPTGTELRLDLGELEAAAWFERDRLPLWRSPLLEPLIAAGVLTPIRSCPGACS